MILKVRLREVNVTLASPSDNSINLGGLTPPAVELDEYSFKVFARDYGDFDNANWSGGACHFQQFNPPGLSNDWNDQILFSTYFGSQVPGGFDIKLDAFEDDIPSDFAPYGGLTYCNTGNVCTFEGQRCCIFGCLFANESDDIRCDGDTFRTRINYRAAGPPCQWNDHGFLTGTCPANNYYKPHIESFWQYTRGTGCYNAINLGSIGPGQPQLSHYNSTVCYSNNFTNSPGNDVFYEFTVTQPMGLRAYLCGSITNFNSYLYLLDSTCTVMTSNDNFCGNVSEINWELCAPGRYVLVVDGATAGSMGEFEITVAENPNIIVNANAGIDWEVCLGATVTLGAAPTAFSGQGPYSYNWNLANNVSNPQVSPVVTTQYIVTVTDALGCTAQDTMDLVVNQPPTPNLGPNVSICPTGVYQLDAGPGYIFYSWNTGASSQSIQVNNPGLYFVTVVDTNGCVGTDTATINAVPIPSLFIGVDTIICDGDSALLDAGPLFQSYLWNTGSTASSIWVKNGGSYSVHIQDITGCTNNDTAVVTVVTNPTVNLGPDKTVCPGQSVFLDAGPGLLNYQWSNGSTNQFVNTTTPGTYIAIVSTFYGCADTDTVVMANYPQPSLNLGPNLAFCDGDLKNIDAGPGWANYAWNTGSTAQFITVGVPGLYYVHVTDVNGCTTGDTTSATVYPNPSIDLGPDTTLCYPDVKVFQILGYPSVTWQDGSTNPVHVVNLPGDNTVGIVVTDVNGCTAGDQAVITLAPEIQINDIPDTVVCFGTEFVLDAGSAGNEPYTYVWSNGSTNQMITVNAPGTYWVEVSNAYGCTVSESGTVTMANIVQGNLAPNGEVCTGEELILDLGAGYASYTWSTGDSSQFIVVTTANAGTFFVQVETQDGCLIEDKITITAVDPPVLDLGPDQLICPGDLVVLDAGNSFNSYLWTDNSTGQTFDVTAAGIYGVTVFYGSCEQTDLVQFSEECPQEILIPNVFSPNGDGFNDLLQFVGQNIELFELYIYNRWGNPVFTSTSITKSWDGILPGGGKANEGVYFYVVKYKFNGNDKEWEERGNVTLLR
ncbi:MAG: gliding motility-associated C-terminal domain-containing protein [Bacteroidia bacterium]|nr:gliding motility-associated C-terminal domain-containing protein [Bacteroidia bacterium]